MRIGLISDTHLPQILHSLDQLGPEPGEALQDVDLILHGGDVTTPAVLDWCEQFAPVLVARGNNDIFNDPRMAEHQFVDVHGVRVGMAHELRPESRPIPDILASALNSEAVDVLIGGDTHVERLEYRDNVLLINAGSPSLPHHLSTRLGAIGLLTIEPDRVRAEIFALGSGGIGNNGAAPRNPTRPQHVVIEHGVVRDASLDGQPLPPDEFLQPPAQRRRNGPNHGP